MYQNTQLLMNYLHLVDNLVHVTCHEDMESMLFYYIFGAKSVYIRSIYQENYNTCIIHFDVPEGELDHNIAEDFISASQQTVWNYSGTVYQLNCKRAIEIVPQHVLHYSTFLTEGYVPSGSSIVPWHILYNLYYMRPEEACLYSPLQFLEESD